MTDYQVQATLCQGKTFNPLEPSPEKLPDPTFPHWPSDFPVFLLKWRERKKGGKKSTPLNIILNLAVNPLLTILLMKNELHFELLSGTGAGFLNTDNPSRCDFHIPTIDICFNKVTFIQTIN